MLQRMPPTDDQSRNRRYGYFVRPRLAFTTKRRPGTYRPTTSMTGALEPRNESAEDTFSFCFAFSTWGPNRLELIRASQYSAETPTIAPRAPATTTQASVSLPWAASVD